LFLRNRAISRRIFFDKFWCVWLLISRPCYIFITMKAVIFVEARIQLKKCIEIMQLDLTLLQLALMGFDGALVQFARRTNSLPQYRQSRGPTRAVVNSRRWLVAHRWLQYIRLASSLGFSPGALISGV
jgi:hypothetical protein